jgi:transcriptional regulator with XRE-family HTH domain
MADIGQRIRAVREAKGLTQVEVAQRLEVVQTTIGMYEKSADLKHSVIRQLAEILEVSTSYLTGDDPVLEPLGEWRVTRMESLRIFLRSHQSLTEEERLGFQRIQGHALAPATVAGWRSLRNMIRTYMDLPPDVESDGADEQQAVPATAFRLTRKRMAKATPQSMRLTLRRVG